ncbi:MAG: PAS domain S-box protein [Candidatus Omnitrophica bacterium]|nr:PAS domain S-box protein [Candidatus Omnitrophota bacterium]
MAQNDKNKEELIPEIKLLQERVAELEMLIGKLRKTEEALYASKMQFQELFNNMGNGVAIYEARDGGSDFILININRSGEQISKIQREQAVGRSVLEVFPGVKKLGLFDVFCQVWKTGQPQRYPVSFYQDERMAQWVENYVYKIPSGEIVAVYDDVTERKRFEDALQESEERFMALFDNINMGVSIIDTNYKIIKVNKYHARLFKKDPRDFENKECFRAYEKRQSVCAHCPGAIVMKGLPAPEVETRGIRDDGSFVYVLIRSVPIHDKNGAYSGFIELVEDITERKKTDEFLKESKDYLDSIINTIGDPVFVKDSQHRLVLVNDAECALIGRSREEIIGKTDYEFFPKEQVDVFWAKDEELLKTGKENISEEVITDAFGAKKVIVTKKALYVDKKMNKFIVGIIRDITERKIAEERVRDYAVRLSYLTKYANDFIILLDENFCFLEVNERVSDFYGYTQEELIGMHAPQLRAQQVREDFSRQVKPAQIEGKALYETVHQRKDGQTFPVEISLRAIDIEGKRFYQAIIRDITERKKVEEENAKYTRELEIFYKASIGREERIIELKKELEVLKKKSGEVN